MNFFIPTHAPPIAAMPATTGAAASAATAPVAKEIMGNVLRYMNIEPEGEVKNSSQNMVTVPDLKTMKYSTAVKYLHNVGLKAYRMEDARDSNSWAVVDQYPKSGEKVEKGTTVYLYKE